MSIEYRDRPTMNPRNTRQLRSLIERRQGIRHWGKLRFVTPRLVDKVFGDGRVLLLLYPIMFRPNHFVVRIDSSWSTSNWEHDSNKRSPAGWLDEVYDAIEDEYPEWPWAKTYGLRWTEDRDEERSSRTDFADGSCWETMDWPRVKRAHANRRRRAAQ